MPEKYCNKECKEVGPICDFCRFYNFNSDKYGIYIGKGYCVRLENRKEPEDGCKYFICMNYKKNNSSMKLELRQTDIICDYLKKHNNKYFP